MTQTELTTTLESLLTQFKRLGWSTAGWDYREDENVGPQWLKDRKCPKCGTTTWSPIGRATQTDLDTLLGIGVREFIKIRLIEIKPHGDGWRVVTQDYEHSGPATTTKRDGSTPYAALIAACRQLPTPEPKEADPHGVKALHRRVSAERARDHGLNDLADRIEKGGRP